MSFEFNSQARVWINLPDTSDYPSPLKLTISDVAQLYRVCGDALRAYSAQTADVLVALDYEADPSS